MQDKRELPIRPPLHLAGLLIEKEQIHAPRPHEGGGWGYTIELSYSEMRYAAGIKAEADRNRTPLNYFASIHCPDGSTLQESKRLLELFVARLGQALKRAGFPFICITTYERERGNQESAIAKLDKYNLLVLDDLAYVSKDQAETSVLFELIAARYERRSMLITANQPFGEWGKVFPDQAMTLAAIDRLVHHATILEMNVESYRRKTAIERKRRRGRPAEKATIKSSSD